MLQKTRWQDLHNTLILRTVITVCLCLILANYQKVYFNGEKQTKKWVDPLCHGQACSNHGGNRSILFFLLHLSLAKASHQNSGSWKAPHRQLEVVAACAVYDHVPQAVRVQEAFEEQLNLRTRLNFALHVQNSSCRWRCGRTFNLFALHWVETAAFVAEK